MDRVRLPSLATLRAFEATVRLGSMARAAEELDLTVGAVSRAVRELEVELGSELFRRGSRLIVPSPLARNLAGEVAEAMGMLRSALVRAQALSRSGQRLVLACEPTLLVRWLMPRIDSLREAMGPGREVRLVAAGRGGPFDHEGIDLAIVRSAAPTGSGVVAAPFLEERMGPVCRPELAEAIASAGPVEGVLLHAATRPEAWTTWARLSGTELLPTQEIRFDHFCPCMQATTTGAGLAVGPVALVADLLASGDLVAPRGLWRDGTHYALLRPENRVGRDFDAVLDWLRDMAAGLPAPVS